MRFAPSKNNNIFRFYEPERARKWSQANQLIEIHENQILQIQGFHLRVTVCNYKIKVTLKQEKLGK